MATLCPGDTTKHLKFWHDGGMSIAVTDPAKNQATDLDCLMTVKEFAAWLGVREGWVRKRLRLLPGVIFESRETIRIHPRTYLDRRLSFRKPRADR